jgi:hypothetical protein
MGFLDEIIDPKTATRHIEQGSEEWDKIRCGRFTASEFHFLMDAGKIEMTADELKARPKSGKGSSVKYKVDYSKFSAAGDTYINRKVAERLTGRIQESSYAFPLVYGKDMEGQAVEYFQETKNLECYECGFVAFGDYAGGSPDRLVEGNGGLEVKCPYTSEKQIEYLMLTDVFDLKRCFPEIYWQIMTNMFFATKDHWHLITYDPRFENPKHKMTHMIIEPNAEAFDLIGMRLEKGVEKMLSTIQLLS